jgi:RsiW-degrading membrane proteinase PrsW (M82 family)
MGMVDDATGTLRRLKDGLAGHPLAKVVVVRGSAMAFVVECECGNKLNVKEEFAGKKARCTKCGRPLTLSPATSASPQPSSRPAKVTQPDEKPRTWNRRYLFLALALLPLLFSVVGSDDAPFLLRLKSTIDSAPAEVTAKVEKAFSSNETTLDDIINLLPGAKLEGALLARNTWIHWAFALLSAGAAGLSLALLFKVDKKTLRTLGLIALFTGTVGIAFLLLVQLMASWTQGAWLRGRGIITLVFYIVKFIGFSYRAALDPENGFAASFFGFTFGVGFCEELCKALPLIYTFRSKTTLDWRAACVWGLASGVGFGVSEGITYSSDFYNGISSGGIYVVRFVSCVALHSFWTASVGISMHERQATIQGPMNWYDWIQPLLMILGVPMVLHGLYDTVLKRDMGLLAVVIAAATFGWLAWKIEQHHRHEAVHGVSQPAA